MHSYVIIPSPFIHNGRVYIDATKPQADLEDWLHEAPNKSRQAIFTVSFRVSIFSKA